MKLLKAEVYKSNDGWRWRSVAKNGEIVAQGEAYEHRDDAAAAAEASVPAGTPIVVGTPRR